MRVAVIGSGATGLAAIKSCKEEGLEIVCYERSESIGGLWRYRDSDEEGLASVAKSTIINTSKELTSYSDFPPPKEFSNFMHNTMMFKYLQLYAEHFELVPHIKFRHRVESVVPTDDYDSTGRWRITSFNLETGKEVEEVVDAVMVCTGHHVFPNIPTFPGQEKFKGIITHTHSYKKAGEFQDKRVVVVGVGNSAGDAAVETSNVAKKVYLSTRRGCWVMQRVGKNGKPYDDLLLTRYNNILFSLFTWNICNNYVEDNLNRTFDHESYQLKPKHRFFEQHPMINDALPNRILSGTVAVKGNIERFEEDGIVFEGESEVTPVDHVILATGYDIKFPFIGKDILDTTDNRVGLYKFVFPPGLKHPTLSILGLFQSLGGLFPVSEMQSRWAVLALQRKVLLPCELEMRQDIDRHLQQIRARYYDSKRHTIQVDYTNYLDEIASLIGVKPNFFKMYFCDRKLFWTLIMGPSLPYQYRLEGPHSWSQARKVIMDYEDRLHSPLQTRYAPVKKEEKHSFSLFPALLMILISFSLFKILSVSVE